LLSILGQRLSIKINLSYIQHIFNLPLSFFATRRVGEIVSRFTDVNLIIDALASTILSLFLDVSILLVVGAALLAQNINLFLYNIGSHSCVFINCFFIYQTLQSFKS
jgi:ABC-type bacteriocin/lantibiotic exporter with double-glycine peptidase domain